MPLFLAMSGIARETYRKNKRNSSRVPSLKKKTFHSFCLSLFNFRLQYKIKCISCKTNLSKGALFFLKSLPTFLLHKNREKAKEVEKYIHFFFHDFIFD